MTWYSADNVFELKMKARATYNYLFNQHLLLEQDNNFDMKKKNV